MKLEYLYPELGNLFGDSGNLRYLQACLPEVELIETHLGETPACLQDEEVCFLYTGSMTERGQGLALAQLEPFRNALDARLQAGLYGLFTGNSMELLGGTIHRGEDSLRGLSLLSLEAREATARYNDFFLGDWDGIAVTGFNSRFTHAHAGDGVNGVVAVRRGCGLEPGSPFAAYRYHNLFGTYLLGPLLVLNPLLTERLLRALGSKEKPAFWEEAMEAYEQRLLEFQDKKRKQD